MDASIQKYLNQFLSDKLNLRISSFQFLPVGGGSINDTFQLTINHTIKFFLKLNSAARYPRLFEKERNGLEFLGKQKIIHVPALIAFDEIGGHQVLLLEWIEGGLKTEKFWKQFGEQLAALHHTTNLHFGFEEDNYMGALPQLNNQQKNWIEFFIHCRLEPQIKMAGEKHFLQTKHLDTFEHLYSRLTGIFNIESPSLLHGDLWSGNFMCNQNSEPVLIDPAVYFGHRSMDLAMTTLFGDFDKPFYESYHYHLPLPRNHHEQWEICNLYPLLIHLNLFGRGYLGQIEAILRKFG
ncbi:MAG: fructosamine kinase family protein [Chitinophagales bacterium]